MTEAPPLPPSIDSCVDSIKNIIIEIELNNHRRTELHCTLGKYLAQMKYLYITNKCELCEHCDDIFDVITCRTCTNSKRNSLREYFKKAKDITKKSVSYINYLIDIAKLCKIHPKFVFNSMPIDLIKKHLSYLKSAMAKDTQFWQNTS